MIVVKQFGPSNVIVGLISSLFCYDEVWKSTFLLNGVLCSNLKV